MGYLSQSNRKKLRVKLTFANNLVYEASMKNTTDKILESISVYESEAKTTSNLLGIINSNNISFRIIDNAGVLLQTDSNKSEYRPYLGSGVKVEIFEDIFSTSGELESTSKKGEYYTDSWSSLMRGKVENLTSIYCYDKLSHIGQKEVPALGALNDLSVGSVLDAVFNGIGLVKGVDYTVDSSLNLGLIYPVTKGSKVRETLNEIAQVLIARITCDRDGIIRVKPAFNSVIPEPTLILSNKYGSNFSIKNNTDIGNYTYVKVGYANVSLEDVSSTLTSPLRDVHIEAGSPKQLTDIEIPKNTQSVDAVQVRGLWGQDDPGVRVVSYDRTPNGLNIMLMNDSTSAIDVDVVIKGKSIITSNAYVFDDEKDTSGNVFEVNNIFIQSEEAAREFANNVKRYILGIKHRYSIVAYIDMEIKCGDYIRVESSSDNISGVFYVNGLSFSISNSCQVTIDAIKVG